jgi:hypothetical protein
MTLSEIFDKENFTLKELCQIIKNIKYIPNCSNTFIEISNIKIISDCYIKFSSCNNSYNKLLECTRNNKGYLCINKNNKIIYFREILQILDMEFTKLVIRIKTEPKNYDIIISWKDFEEKIGINKEDIKKLFFEI